MAEQKINQELKNLKKKDSEDTETDPLTETENDYNSETESDWTQSSESGEWVTFGFVSHLMIYPIDRGTGYEMNKAVCRKNGIETVHTDPILGEIKDRLLVVYDDTKDEVILDPYINRTNYDFSICYYGNAQTLEINPVPENIKITNKNYAINHEEEEKREEEKRKEEEERGGKGMRSNNKKKDMPIPLRCLRPHHYEPLKDLLSKRGKDLKVGYFTQSDRQKLNDERRFSETIANHHGLHQHYSHYTLINASSLKDLKKEYQNFLNINRITGENSNNITYSNFFPHIVIDWQINNAFQEDAVIGVKIGNVQFGKILPCIHNNTINFNYSGRSPLEHFYQFLSNYRPLKSIGRKFSTESELPVFGINMEKTSKDLCEYDKICVGDTVYVKFRTEAAK